MLLSTGLFPLKIQNVCRFRMLVPRKMTITRHVRYVLVNEIINPHSCVSSLLHNVIAMLAGILQSFITTHGLDWIGCYVILVVVLINWFVPSFNANSEWLFSTSISLLYAFSCSSPYPTGLKLTSHLISITQCNSIKISIIRSMYSSSKFHWMPTTIAFFRSSHYRPTHTCYQFFILRSIEQD